MAELEAALDDVLSGQGRFVMLSGEPGIGKTRTAQEFASHAGDQDAHVLRGPVLRRQRCTALLAVYCVIRNRYVLFYQRFRAFLWWILPKTAEKAPNGT